MTLSPDPKAPAPADTTATTSTPTTATTATPAAAPSLHAVPDTSDARAISESILFEVRRVIVGQDLMLERVQ